MARTIADLEGEFDVVGIEHVASALSRSFANLDVQGTQNADEALHLLEDERSRLLITDAQSSRLDGIAVATSARQRRPTLPVIVMSNAGRGNRPAKTLPLSAIWLAKPPKPERLVGLVRRFLAVPVGFSGEISLDSLPELIQLLCMTNVSGALHVERGAQRGSIFFDHGMIVDAVSGGSHGVSVFNQMLRWQGGLFALDRDTVASLERMAEKSAAHLVDATVGREGEAEGRTRARL